ncbi:nitrogenase component 1 [uncultured Sunxiuqinia sp.]|uniref:nitrogenase component 1 n=1 Tax=uncultured Sunxiuqinia sp. TaxID=1573825 RepID=UPI002AA7FE61|nr:nitrogenase component 1 [uncultured Sunxiuqinia sp.]
MFENAPKLKSTKEFTATRNACKLCAPLGASIAFKGIRGCVPIIHGGQGCATYIRRYLISHYKEPVDIASSNFSEEATVFGGGANCYTALNNVIGQYNPEVVAMCTTCLSETIGDDVNLYMHNYKEDNKHENLPHIVTASTPSYQGSHMDGFHEAVASAVRTFAKAGAKGEHVNLFPGFVSTEDLRQLKYILSDFGLDYVMVPDYSDTLDNPIWKSYKRIPEGGTSISEIETCGSAAASIEFGTVINQGSLSGRVRSKSLSSTAASYLQKEFGVENYQMPMPIGVKLSDAFFEALEKISGKEMPTRYMRERGRLIDSYADGHKYIFGKKAVVYGEEDFVIAMTTFLDEIGIDVVLAATGGESGKLESEIRKYCPERGEKILAKNHFDYENIHEWCQENKPDLFVGNSKAYYIARELQVPIIRSGFPIHDRIGGQRIKHVGYSGTQELFDKVVNALIEYKQDHSSVGYKYM